MKTINPKKIICYGEVLWDNLPNTRKIGGAPLNVAIRLSSFGNDVTVVSKIGKDKDGEEIIKYLKDHNMDTKHIQIDDFYETGNVSVMLNEKGSASYDIKYPRAWDKIENKPELINLVKQSDAFVYGSLSSRDIESKNTLLSLLEVANFKIFDVNLRPPYYKKEVLLELMHNADFIKFNDEELYEIAGYLNSKTTLLEQNIMFISEITNTKSICVTKGRHGAILLHNNKLYMNLGYQVKVKDTVGAGDSFLGTLITNLLNNTEPQKAIDLACAVGALVTQKEGANPEISQKDIESILN